MFLVYFRDEIRNARERLWTYRVNLGAEPWPDYAKGLWKNYTHDFTAIVEEDINKKVDRFNLLVPALHLQTVHYNPQKEVDKVMRKYRELREKGELPHQVKSRKKKPEQHCTVVQRQMYDQIPVREIWKHIKALFSR